MKKFLLTIALAGVFLIVSGTAVFSMQMYGWDAGFECLKTGADMSVAMEGVSEVRKELSKKKTVTFRDVAKMPVAHTKKVNDILEYDNAAPGDIYAIVQLETVKDAAMYIVFVQPGGKWVYWGWWIEGKLDEVFK